MARRRSFTRFRGWPSALSLTPRFSGVFRQGVRRETVLTVSRRCGKALNRSVAPRAPPLCSPGNRKQYFSVNDFSVFLLPVSSPRSSGLCGPFMRAIFGCGSAALGNMRAGPLDRHTANCITKNGHEKDGPTNRTRWGLFFALAKRPPRRKGPARNKKRFRHALTTENHSFESFEPVPLPVRLDWKPTIRP